MRQVDPFEYWVGHASAIEGLGGPARSPDPRYCFHTAYHTVRPGHASFVLKLTGVSASFGELAIRIHAWKPATDSNISLVSGSRLLLLAQEDGELTLSVSFAALKDVVYACYGYLSEDSDVTASDLQVAIDEPEDGAEIYPDAPHSVLALDRGTEDVRPANALLHFGEVTIARPVSQSCTQAQLSDLDGGAEEVLARWEQALCIHALQAYGATVSGLDGLVVGQAPEDWLRELEAGGMILAQGDGDPPALTSGEFFDVVLLPNLATDGLDATARWERCRGWLARLKVGGLAVVGLRYRPSGDLLSSSAALDTDLLSRNEIGQWALRLIGDGYSVAPLAFAPLASLATDSRGLAAFALVVQRT